jgi:hypothetical protein
MRSRVSLMTITAVLLGCTSTALAGGAAGPKDARDNAARDRPYLTWDFSTSDLSQVPWLYDVWNGDTPPTYRATVQSAPTSPSATSRSVKIVTADGQRSSSRSGELSMLNDTVGRPWEAERRITWYRVDVLFPSGNKPAYPGSFRSNSAASESSFNKFLSWHENGFNDGYTAPNSSAYSVHPRASQSFRFDFFGGDGRGRSTFNGTRSNRGTASWISALDVNAKRKQIPLVKDHWYRIVSQIKWSRTAGWAKIWIDGRLAFPNPVNRLRVRYNGSYTIPAKFPTLWWDYNRNTSGRVWMMVGHYRTHATWTDTLYMGNIKVGPTRASVIR